MEKVLIATMHELFKFCAVDGKWLEEGMTKTLSQKPKPLFRVLAADTGKEVFFNNLEMLGRYSAMPLPDQYAFCQTIRKALKKARVTTLKLTVKWSESEEKILIIRQNDRHDLDINM